MFTGDIIMSAKLLFRFVGLFIFLVWLFTKLHLWLDFHEVVGRL